jgi:hypothetical protein
LEFDPDDAMTFFKPTNEWPRIFSLSFDMVIITVGWWLIWQLQAPLSVPTDHSNIVGKALLAVLSLVWLWWAAALVRIVHRQWRTMCAADPSS